MGRKNNGIPRERILSEAEALFAERGFYAVTIREITQSAKCNLAAVNYHFGNKQNLYMEVFRSLWKPRARRVLERFESLLSAQAEMTLAGIVRSVAEAFIKGPLTDEERLRHSQLMVREMATPTQAFDMIVTDVMAPFQLKLAELIRPFVSGGTDRNTLLLHIQSIMSMVIHFNFARNPVTRITGRHYDGPFKNELVDHIVHFSLTGLSGNGGGMGS